MELLGLCWDCALAMGGWGDVGHRPSLPVANPQTLPSNHHGPKLKKMK
jgi:hypothetical protein